MPVITTKVKCPTPPNYVSIEIPGVVCDPRKMSELPKIRILDLTSEQRDELAAEWRAELDKIAKRQEEIAEGPFR